MSYTTLGKYYTSKSQIHKNQFIPDLKISLISAVLEKIKILLYCLSLISDDFRSLQTLVTKYATVTDEHGTFILANFS